MCLLDSFIFVPAFYSTENVIFPYISVLQIVKFQNHPAKIRMVVDSYHSTPQEMTFESARVRQDDKINLSIKLAASLTCFCFISVRNATRSASSSC